MRSESHSSNVLFAGLRLLLIAAGILMSQMFSPVEAFQSRSSSSQARRILQAQRQRATSQLQQQWAAATKALEAAGGEFASAEAAVKSATSQVESARDALEAQQREVAAASRQLQEQEDRVVEEQPEDSPYGKLARQIEAQERDMDRLMHETLGVPRTVPADEETEQLRKSEALHLTPEQRSRLQANPKYAADAAKHAKLTSEIKTLRQTLLESDKDWRVAHESHHAAVERRQEADKSLREASGDAARARKHFKEVAAVVASARTAAQTAEAQLRALGAKPTLPQDR